MTPARAGRSDPTPARPQRTEGDGRGGLRPKRSRAEAEQTSAGTPSACDFGVGPSSLGSNNDERASWPRQARDVRCHTKMWLGTDHDLLTVVRGQQPFERRDRPDRWDDGAARLLRRRDRHAFPAPDRSGLPGRIWNGHVRRHEWRHRHGAKHRHVADDAVHLLPLEEADCHRHEHGWLAGRHARLDELDDHAFGG